MALDPENSIWVILRYFANSMKNNVSITSKQGYHKLKVK